MVLRSLLAELNTSQGVSFQAEEDIPDYFYTDDSPASGVVHRAMQRFSLLRPDLAFEVDWWEHDGDQHWLRVYHQGRVIYRWNLWRPELAVDLTEPARVWETSRSVWEPLDQE